MSALHQAVTRVIADALWGDEDEPSVDAAAAAAIGVVLAEATRSIEALPTAHGVTASGGLGAPSLDRGEALAVLAALAEDTPVPYRPPFLGPNDRLA